MCVSIKMYYYFIFFEAIYARTRGEKTDCLSDRKERDRQDKGQSEIENQNETSFSFQSRTASCSTFSNNEEYIFLSITVSLFD